MNKLLTVVCTILCMISCCSYQATDHTEVERLRIKLGQKDAIIKAYEQFRTTAIDIYLTEVDSTGDGFDETDKGVDFWTQSADIDSLLKKDR